MRVLDRLVKYATSSLSGRASGSLASYDVGRAAGQIVEPVARLARWALLAPLRLLRRGHPRQRPGLALPPGRTPPLPLPTVGGCSAGAGPARPGRRAARPLRGPVDAVR